MARRSILLLVIALLWPSAAMARPRDRDRDGMADRWERRHGVKSPKADRDRDGLTNRFEYRRRTNPRKADTDGDGLGDADEFRFAWHPRRADTDADGRKDGAEGSGWVQSGSAEAVAIRLPGGAILSARLDDDTEMICPADQHDGREVDDESEEGWDPNAPSEEPSSGGGVLGLGGGAQQQDEPEEPFVDRCVAFFKPGALVHEATVANGVFKRVELVGAG